MNTAWNLRKERTHIKRELNKVLSLEGSDWRAVKAKERIMKQKFLRVWIKYIKNNKNKNDFLKMAKEFGYLLQEERHTHVQYKKKFGPLVIQYNKLTKSLMKSKSAKL